MTVANLIFKNFLLKNEILLRLLLSLKAGIIGIQQKSDKYIRIYLAKINICFVCINIETKSISKNGQHRWRCWKVHEFVTETCCHHLSDVCEFF